MNASILKIECMLLPRDTLRPGFCTTHVFEGHEFLLKDVKMEAAKATGPPL